MPEIPAGWHPDPFARFQHRYWDGAAWTEQVSTNGVVSNDEPVEGPATPAADVLDLKALAFGYGASGMITSGAWPVVDRRGRMVASVIVEGAPMNLGRRYVLLDPARRVILTTEKMGRMSSNFTIADAFGAEVGRFIVNGKTVSFVVGSGVWGTAMVDEFSWKGTFVQTAQAQLHAAIDPVAIVDSTQTQVGHLLTHTPTQPLPSISGWHLDPNGQWFILERDAGLTDPLRQFAVLLPAYVARTVGWARNERFRTAHRPGF